MDDIICYFCEKTGVKYDDCISKRGATDLWLVRYMIWHYLHATKKVSTSTIANKFGRTKANIFRGVRLFKHQLRYNKRTRDLYESVVNGLS